MNTDRRMLIDAGIVSWDRWLKIAVSIAALVGAVWGGLAWWSSRSVAAANIQRDVADLELRADKTDARLEAVSKQLRDIGVLQIEQGQDHRRLLIQLIGHPEQKPRDLIEAERRVQNPPQ